MAAREGFIKQTDLVSGHAVLLHLLKPAFEFLLTFALLLRTTHIHLSTIELFAIHVIHSLQDATKAQLKTTKLHQKHVQSCRGKSAQSI